MRTIYVKFTAKAKAHLKRAGCVFASADEEAGKFEIPEEAYRGLRWAARREGVTISTILNLIFEGNPLELRAMVRRELRQRSSRRRL